MGEAVTRQLEFNIQHSQFNIPSYGSTFTLNGAKSIFPPMFTWQ